MYITLFAIVFAVGLVLLFLPFKFYKKWTESRLFSVIIRVTGIILCIISAILIYAVLSGKIVLPLIKQNLK